MSDFNRTLSEQIEQLVREHIEVIRRAAGEAVERAFTAVSSSPRGKVAPRARGTSSRRRGPAEVAELGERLYQAMCAQPGETMSVLAPEVGRTARELQRPMMALKREGRIRSVGQRHLTRYFPAVVRPAAMRADQAFAAPSSRGGGVPST